MTVHVELWAQQGIDDALDEYVRAEQPFTAAAVICLIREAYSLGYMAAHSDPEPLTILDAMTRSTQLGLLLP